MAISNGAKLWIGLSVAGVLGMLRWFAGAGAAERPLPAQEWKPPPCYQKKIDPSDLYYQCKDIVSRALASPGSAVFSKIDFRGVDVSAEPACVTRMPGYVDSQNKYGALLRTSFICKHDPATGMVEATELNLK